MQTFWNNIQTKLLNYYETSRSTPIISWLLNICSIFYTFGYKIRLAMFNLGLLKKYWLNAYVISVGNITTGGTGKTPFTIEIAKYFLSHNEKVAVLLRGYKGKNTSKEVILVSDGTEILSDYDTVGEEAILIANSIPKAMVLAGKNRYKAGLAAISLGATVIILDDGYQHLKIQRNANILLIDSYAPFDNGMVLPRGKLREHTSSIARATSIILTNCDRKKVSEKELKIISSNATTKDIFQIKSRFKGLKGINTKKSLEEKNLKKMECIAFSGIGNPNSFLDLLKRHEVIIKASINFPDHHDYSSTDINNLVELAKKHNIENIITTEKDAIKLEELCLSAPRTFWHTSLELIWDDNNLFDKIFNNFILLKERNSASKKGH